ncbi:hypothetical protein BGW37DRAFT_488155 [Umbelopsis sp. PMI_123]|nr:hypothetical protein BGW37DRAFT_488155 [Umbelopsis sp. PMI_123]
MKISSLLAGPTPSPSPSTCSYIMVDNLKEEYQKRFDQAGFKVVPRREGRLRSLTDYWISSYAVPATSLHFKVIKRHSSSNCYRCHISSGKSGSPIQSVQIKSQMKMVLVFFRRNDEDNTVFPHFLLFPGWLLHVFRYSQYGNVLGRCDVRFLEDATTAKEDQVFRFNNVINTLFSFDIDHIDKGQIETVIGLSNHLADIKFEQGIRLPDRKFSYRVHHLFADMVDLLRQQRPEKLKPACMNCCIKPSSRRSLCVACYRYQLKNKVPRPERLIIANRLGPKMPPTPFKICVNCRVEKTHQWYRNVLGNGHWCETCKSYYVRHNILRPRKLYIRAARRKADLLKFMCI